MQTKMSNCIFYVTQRYCVRREQFSFSLSRFAKEAVAKEKGKITRTLFVASFLLPFLHLTNKYAYQSY